MRYTDKNGNEIREGMTLLMSDGSREKVYAIQDADGNPGLGISASNEDYLKNHGSEREYYPLSIFGKDDVEIVPENNRIKVLVVEPMKAPYEKEIDEGLASLQHEVGGTIQAIYPFEEEVAIICNVEHNNM